jgi:hypothetical protein
VAGTLLVFGLAGPAVGGLVVFLPRGDFSLELMGLAHVFGLGPALVAGALFSVVRLRKKDALFPWHARARWGAGAGLIGSLVFVILGGTYTLVTAGTSTLQHELRFHGWMLMAGVSAGATCALVMPRVRT